MIGRAWRRWRPGKPAPQGVGWRTAVNLLWPTWECGEWEPWETVVAVSTAQAIVAQLFPQHAGVVLLGRRVTAAFGLTLPPLSSCSVSGVPVLSLPHPSGSNRAMTRAQHARTRDVVDAFLWGEYGVLGESPLPGEHLAEG